MKKERIIKASEIGGLQSARSRLIVEQVLIKNDKDYDVAVRDCDGASHILYPHQSKPLMMLVRK